jgi:large subunit ribosomal protein L2
MAAPIRVVRPTTSARRKMSYLTYEEITKKSPEKSLLIPLKKHAGRDKLGHISIRHRGGGAKRMYRVMDFSGLKHFGQVATIKSIEYDPNRSAHIALVEYETGKKAYILAAKGMTVGKALKTDKTSTITTGNRLPLSAIPTGTPIHNIELTPGKGGQIVRAAGTSATILAKEGTYATVRLPSGEVRLVHATCFATIGEVSNASHNAVRYAKAGRIRHMGRRPQVRGKAMNPVDHPHGGGEGNAPIGLKHPKTPTGRPALGYKTRRRKLSSQFIVRPRSKKGR